MVENCRWLVGNFIFLWMVRWDLVMWDCSLYLNGLVSGLRCVYWICLENWKVVFRCWDGGFWFWCDVLVFGWYDLIFWVEFGIIVGRWNLWG